MTVTDKKLYVNYINVIKKTGTDNVSVLVFFIDGNVARTFLYGSLIAVWNGLYNPMCYILGRRIEWQDGVEVLMVELSMNESLYLGEVNHHTVFVKFACLAIHLYNPVMAVKGLAFAFAGESEVMTSGNLHSLFYVIHLNN